QRLRPAAAATSYVACPMCEGYGLVRTTESAALVALRKIHNRVAQGDVASIRVSVPADVGLYLLNQKREDVAQLERRYAIRIHVVLSAGLMPHQPELEVRPRVEGKPAEDRQPRLGGVAATEPEAPEPVSEAGNSSGETPAETTATSSAAAPETGKGPKRRRRR